MKLRQVLRVAILLLICSTPYGLGAQTEPLPLPPDAVKNGVVPDLDTAIKIAEAVLIPIYGEKQIASERPFKGELKGDVWKITGSLSGGSFVVGGVAYVDISKSTGRIEKIWHSM